MKFIFNLVILTFSLAIPFLKSEAKEDKVCLKFETEEDTGASIYNASHICGGMR